MRGSQSGRDDAARPAATPREIEDPGARAAPLRVLLPFAVLNSFAAGTTSSGIYFIAKSAYDVSVARSAGLGLVFGLGYALGATNASRVLRGATALRPGATSRDVLRWIVTALAITSPLPVLFQNEAALWILLAVYAPLCGLLWPLVETYLSGGRVGSALRSAVGRFSLTWSTALVIAFWSMAPLIAAHPLALLAGVASLHAASLALLPRLAREPGRHLHVEADAPAGYARLLGAHRVLLATSYLVMYALLPLLPALLERVGIPLLWQTPFTSVWLIARVGTFALLERSEGWHGRVGPALLGAVATFGGFALAVLAPEAPGGIARAQLAVGLAAFGVGVAFLYYAALYYALEVGDEDVGAGGAHETMIGIGYTAGPLLGLAASGMAATGLIDPGHRDAVMLGAVALACVAAVAIAVRALRPGGFSSGRIGGAPGARGASGVR